MDIDDLLIPNVTRLHARAYYLGERIDLKTFDRGGARPLAVMFRPVGDGFAAVFRYGSLVTVHVTPEDAKQYLEQLTPHVSGASQNMLSEDALIVVGPDAEQSLGRRSSTALQGVEGDLAVREATNGRLQIIAEVLAKSIALQHFEGRAAEIFDRIEPLASSLNDRAPHRRDKELFQLLSDATVTLVRMAGRVEIHDKPDIAWDRPDLDRLYEHASLEYELRDRDTALTRKLELINQTTNTFFHITQARRTHRVEWYITILIIIEIVLGLLGVWG